MDRVVPDITVVVGHLSSLTQTWFGSVPMPPLF